jgi:hypothetical protein
MRSARRLFFRQAVVSCLGLAVLHAQPSPEKSANTVFDGGVNSGVEHHFGEQNSVQSVIAMARVAPPEFGADVLITLVESGLIADHRTQRDLLEEAFTIAGNAQEKIALKRGGGDGPVTSALHGAFRNGIDQASLRSRAVQAMLKMDSHLARDLFERIELPISPSTGCDQQTVPDLTLYYVTMWEVARNIPDRTQMEAFFAAHMPRFQSAAQITPLARVFMQIRGIEQMPAVIDAFSSRLPDLIQDRRVFSSYFDESIEAIGQLVSSVAASSRERLIQQSRAWVLRGASQGVCAEPPKYTVSFDGIGRKLVPVAEPTERFNQEVAWRSSAPNARINAGELSNRDKGLAAAIVPNSSEYLAHFRTHLLLSRDDDGALDLARWRTEMERYIARLSQWTGFGQGPVQETAQAGSEEQSLGEGLSGHDNSGKGGGHVDQSRSRGFGGGLAYSVDRRADYGRDIFYLEKSDLLTHVLSIERHAPATATSGPVRINWSGAPKREGPRLEIPGRDRVLAALVDLFDGETARKVYADRRVVWFSPVRDLLGAYDRSDRNFAIADLYVSAQHPVLSLYGRLAKLIAAR